MPEKISDRIDTLLKEEIKAVIKKYGLISGRIFVHIPICYGDYKHELVKESGCAFCTLEMACVKQKPPIGTFLRVGMERVGITTVTYGKDHKARLQ